MRPGRTSQYLGRVAPWTFPGARPSGGPAHDIRSVQDRRQGTRGLVPPRDDRGTDRCAAPRAIPRPSRGGRRGCLRGGRRAAWADGAARLPADPGRSPRCRGRLPGDVPRPGAEGARHRPARVARQLALWRGRPHGEGGPEERRPPTVPGGADEREAPRRQADRRSRRRAAGRARRGAEPALRLVPRTGGALRPRGEDPQGSGLHPAACRSGPSPAAWSGPAPCCGPG